MRAVDRPRAVRHQRGGAYRSRRHALERSARHSYGGLRPSQGDGLWHLAPCAARPPECHRDDDSDEHHENGQAVEDATTRVEQMDKRFRKVPAMAAAIAEPVLEGSENADVTLVGWGTTYGPIHEARLLLEADGLSVNHLHFHEVWPFPAARTEQVLGNAKRVIDIENNYTGQLAKVIRMETGINIEKKILKYDGRVFAGDELAQKVREGVLTHA